MNSYSACVVHFTKQNIDEIEALIGCDAFKNKEIFKLVISSIKCQHQKLYPTCLYAKEMA